MVPAFTQSYAATPAMPQCFKEEARNVQMLTKTNSSKSSDWLSNTQKP